MIVAKPFDKLFKTKKTYIILKSGRISGKTKSTAQYVVCRTMEHANLDILVCRDSYSDLKSSLFQEIVEVIEEEGLRAHFGFKTATLSITNVTNNCNIYFKGVGGSDFSRTKGLKPKNKFSLIFFEETQQLKAQSNLDQALATFRRNFATGICKVVIAYNPEPQNFHWLNEYTRMQEHNPDYLIITSSYKDIAQVLCYEDKRAIEIERLINPKNYDYMYMGITNGLFGSVYYTFDREIHLVPEKYCEKLIQKYGIHTIIYGIDGATTRDATAVIPLLLLHNGQIIIPERFYHDPKKNSSLSNEKLHPLIKNYTTSIEIKYKVNQSVPKYYIADGTGHGADLYQTLVYNIVGNDRHVYSFGDKNVIKMAQVVQNVFSRNLILIMDTGGRTNPETGHWEHASYPLVTELESVVWNETGSGFDRMVPNDCTDGLTYAVNFVFRNKHNIYLPRIKEYYKAE